MSVAKHETQVFKYLLFFYCLRNNLFLSTWYTIKKWDIKIFHKMGKNKKKLKFHVIKIQHTAEDKIKRDTIFYADTTDKFNRTPKFENYLKLISPPCLRWLKDVFSFQRWVRCATDTPKCDWCSTSKQVKADYRLRPSIPRLFFQYRGLYSRTSPPICLRGNKFLLLRNLDSRMSGALTGAILWCNDAWCYPRVPV